MSITVSGLHTDYLLDSLRRVDRTAGTLLEKLATGVRINTPSDDPPAQVKTTPLQAEVRALGRALDNINEGISLSTVAQDGLDKMSDLLDAMEDLADEAARVYLGDDDRTVLNSQYQDYRELLQEYATDTTFNQLFTLDGTLSSATPDVPAALVASVAQSQPLSAAEVVVFGDSGLFAGMVLAQRTLSLSSASSQADVVDAINADADIGPLVDAGVDGAGRLVLTSATSGSSVTFELSSNQAAAADSTGLGTAIVSAVGADGEAGLGGAEIQAGAFGTDDDRVSVEIPAVTLEALGLSSSSIETANNAKDAQTELSGAQGEVTRVAGLVTAVLSRLSHAANAVLSRQANTHKAVLRIQDLDTASVQAQLARNQIVNESAQALLAQANVTSEMALSLI